MPNKLPRDKEKLIKKRVFAKADEVGYARSGRVENGRFMDELVEDPEIGGVLKEYMDKERIRTYIKDSVLNRYAKDLNKATLSCKTPEQLIQDTYGEDADEIQKKGNISVLRSSEGTIYVVSTGTVLKWETALKKALELIAKEPTLIQNGIAPKICLHLAVSSSTLADSDKKSILFALSLVGVKAVISER